MPSLDPIPQGDQRIYIFTLEAPIEWEGAERKIDTSVHLATNLQAAKRNYVAHADPEVNVDADGISCTIEEEKYEPGKPIFHTSYVPHQP